MKRRRIRPSRWSGGCAVPDVRAPSVSSKRPFCRPTSRWARTATCSAIAFLHGVALEDLVREDLNRHDPRFPVTIILRAVKSP
jgi:hypothetical protein